MDPVTVVCCNVSDPLPTGIAVTNPARLLSRKRQRSALNAQPASAAAPDQHSSAMFCGNVGAGPECVGVAVAQQQQRQQQQQQQGLIATAAPAQTKEAIGMACGAQATGRQSSVINSVLTLHDLLHDLCKP